MFHKFFAVLLIIVMILAGTQPAFAKQDHKLDVCHKGHTISVDEHAWRAHQKHGDHRGACASSDDATATDNIDTGGGGDNDVAAITRLGAYNPATGTMTIYTVGGVGSFRLLQKYSHVVRWYEVPADWVAININEHRGTLALGILKPGTYYLFAHQWATGNSGDDGVKFIVP